jgi:FkbM family methyltransferase
VLRQNIQIRSNLFLKLVMSLQKYGGKVGEPVKKKNVTEYDNIVAYTSYLKYLVTAFLRYRKTYRNYLGVIIAILKKKYPIEAILRNGSHITFHNHFQAFFISVLQNRKGVKYDPTNDRLTLSSWLPAIEDDNKKELEVYGGINNGDMISTFLDNDYGSLPVRGRVVLDIGANIGDTPIYFALRGASKVIGLEPFPKTYEMAKKNIELNNVSDRVTLLLAGCAANQGHIIIDPNYLSSITSTLADFKQGIKVPLLTLDNILNENNLLSGEVILKMDCEGCEYDTILSASEDTLEKFSHMQIEYHYGYKNLREKLEKSGFIVSYTRPMWNYRKQRGGYIYAKRNK